MNASIFVTLVGFLLILGGVGTLELETLKTFDSLTAIIAMWDVFAAIALGFFFMYWGLRGDGQTPGPEKGAV